MVITLTIEIEVYVATYWNRMTKFYTHYHVEILAKFKLYNFVFKNSGNLNNLKFVAYINTVLAIISLIILQYFIPPTGGGYGQNAQQRLSAERRQQQILRLHQEKLIRSQQARMQQPGMPHPQAPPPGMYPGGPPGYMGGVSGTQTTPPMGYNQAPPQGIPPQMDMQ